MSRQFTASYAPKFICKYLQWLVSLLVVLATAQAQEQEITTTTKRPRTSFFRPSVRRENIRKRVQESVETEKAAISLEDDEDDQESFSVTSSMSSTVSSSVLRRVKPIRGILGRKKEHTNEESEQKNEVEEKEEVEERPRQIFAQRNRFRPNRIPTRTRDSTGERERGQENIDKQREAEAIKARRRETILQRSRNRFRPQVW